MELNETQKAVLQILATEEAYIYHDVVTNTASLVREGFDDFKLRLETFTSLKKANLIERRVVFSNKYILSQAGREAIS